MSDNCYYCGVETIPMWLFNPDSDELYDYLLEKLPEQKLKIENGDFCFEEWLSKQWGKLRCIDRITEQKFGVALECCQGCLSSSHTVRYSPEGDPMNLTYV